MWAHTGAGHRIATVGVTVSGALALSPWMSGSETGMIRRGMARPRRVMAVIAAVNSLVLD